MRTFHWPVRVYYQDTDAGGVVYHAKYFEFFERARVEALREVGVSLETLQANHGCFFVVRTATIEYQQPARLDQALDIVTRVERLEHASIHYQQQVGWEEAVLCKADIHVVCLNSEWRPTRVPETVRGLMK